MAELSHFQSPLGCIEIFVSSKGIRNLKFVAKPIDIVPDNSPVHNWLDAYFSGNWRGLGSLSLDLTGTSFQLGVWRLLATVPYGEKTTYGELARKIGTSPRAIGQAMAANPVWLLIPCHRVIYATGEPGGYAGGIELKKRLLAHEAVTKNICGPIKDLP